MSDTAGVERPNRSVAAGRPVAAYVAHPMLDPWLRRRQRATVRFWLPFCRALVGQSADSRGLGLAFDQPEDSIASADGEPLEPYFSDADRDLDQLLEVARVLRAPDPLPLKNGAGSHEPSV